jgi:hypothetical protein
MADPNPLCHTRSNSIADGGATAAMATAAAAVTVAERPKEQNLFCSAYLSFILLIYLHEIDGGTNEGVVPPVIVHFQL